MTYRPTVYRSGLDSFIFSDFILKRQTNEKISRERKKSHAMAALWLQKKVVCGVWSGVGNMYC